MLSEYQTINEHSERMRCSVYSNELLIELVVAPTWAVSCKGEYDFFSFVAHRIHTWVGIHWSRLRQGRGMHKNGSSRLPGRLPWRQSNALRRAGPTCPLVARWASHTHAIILNPVCACVCAACSSALPVSHSCAVLLLRAPVLRLLTDAASEDVGQYVQMHLMLSHTL